MKDQILQKLLEYLQNTEDFVLEQVPELVQQALKYEKISSYLNSGLMILLLNIAIYLGYYFWKHPVLDKYGSREFGSILCTLIPCIASLLFFIQLCYSVDTLIKIYIAPKYFLICLILDMKN